MINFKIRKIADLLLESGAITMVQHREIARKQKSSNRSVTRIITEDGYITENKLTDLLKEQLNLTVVDLFAYAIDEVAVSSIPKSLAVRHEIIPLNWRDGRLVLAMSDPMDILAVEDVTLFTSFPVEPVIAAVSSINHFINRYYGLSAGSFEDGKLNSSKVKEEDELYGEVKESDEAPVVLFVDSVIHKAAAEGASDIHLEPTEKGLRIRMRVDGELRDFDAPPHNMRHLIISRIKIMANMNIAEKRFPQDGQFKVLRGTNEVSIRASSLPTVHGEKLVLRLLQKEKIVLNMEHIGFTDINYGYLKSFIKSSHGILLLAGPTGCGKSTTLYSTLNHIYTPGLNIVTVEDPVEYLLEGINQVQVNTKIGLTFSSCLRTILRQDPDIIMVGEMRDLETAEIGIRAALTGHLVFSTLHTNNAAQAVVRLIDMGVPDYLVSASLIGVISQRLVRTICDSCREEYIPDSNDKKIFEALNPEDIPGRLFRGKGCNKCQNGYRGRTAIHEVLPFTSDMRKAIKQESSSEILEKMMRSMGLNTLFEDGLVKAVAGITTLDEVKRVAFSDM